MSTAFQPTRWSLVLRAKHDDEPVARAALDELCRIYWPPLCSFARRWGMSDADAEDATQNFFAELLRNDKFAIADAERGKLRTFLLHTFTKRLINQRERDPSCHHVDLEAVPDEPDSQTPDLVFHQQWAVTTMETALNRLANEYAEADKATLFAACRPLLTLDAGGGEDYAAIAQELGMKEGAVRVAAHRLRHRFREVLFTVVAETLDDPTEANVRAEIGALIQALS